MIENLNKEVYIDIEKKRKKYKDSLTLAQKMGIYEKPPEPLSAE